MLAVDFSAVRYSPTEGTHYFYDPAFPSIQFLLSGRWEAWDVGWVRQARDPDIRRIATEAEARWAADDRSGYVPWPATPATYGTPLTSTPTPSRAHVTQLPTPGSPRVESLSSRSTHSRHASSSYDQQCAPVTSAPTTTATTTAAAAAAAAAATAPVLQQQSPPYDHVQPIRPAAPAVNLSRSRETKILLALDGDGIRGLSALLLVESLINAICVKIGQQVDPHQIFDLMGGSSLGGVIAVMLGRLRMQAHRAREAYKHIAKQVYLNKKDFLTSAHPHPQTPQSDGSALEDEIKKVVKQELGNEDERLFEGKQDQGDVFIVTTHMETGTHKPALMRTYKTRRITGPEIDANMPIWQAMKATSVAPRYLADSPPQRPAFAPGLVDHGTAKNNPIRDILYECRKLFRYTNDMMILISIGSGSGSGSTTTTTTTDAVPLSSLTASLAASVDERTAEARAWGDKFEADHHALIDRGWMQYFRFNVPLHDVPLDEAAHEDLVKERTLAYLARPDVGAMFYACVDAVAALLLAPPGR